MEEVEITLKFVGPLRPSPIQVPSKIKGSDLRRLIAENRGLPVERLRLFFRGSTLREDDGGLDVYYTLQHGDCLVVSVASKPPADHLREDEADNDLRFRIPESTSRWKRKLLKGWALIAMWFILAPISHEWDLGPLYILGTGFAIILLNLGHRQQGYPNRPKDFF